MLDSGSAADDGAAWPELSVEALLVNCALLSPCEPVAPVTGGAGPEAADVATRALRVLVTKSSLDTPEAIYSCRLPFLY